MVFKLLFLLIKKNLIKTNTRSLYILNSSSQIHKHIIIIFIIFWEQRVCSFINQDEHIIMFELNSFNNQA